MVKREMSVFDFEFQKKRILEDNRATPELKRWMIIQLLNIFREINHCFPHEMENELAKN
jgi:hypothetical protein